VNTTAVLIGCAAVSGVSLCLLHLATVAIK
jgi:hypothetical protein